MEIHAGEQGQRRHDLMGTMRFTITAASESEVPDRDQTRTRQATAAALTGYTGLPPQMYAPGVLAPRRSESTSSPCSGIFWLPSSSRQPFSRSSVWACCSSAPRFFLCSVADFITAL